MNQIIFVKFRVLFPKKLAKMTEKICRISEFPLSEIRTKS